MLPAISFPNCGEFRLLSETLRTPAAVAWNAVHVPTGRRARVTMLCPPPLAPPEVVETLIAAFRDAAERTRRWESPDTLPVTAVHEANGLPYAVTFLPEGALLDEWLEAQGEQAIPLPVAMRIGSAVAQSVARAHEAALPHGSLHAANVLLGRDHRPYLLDFALHSAAARAARAAGFPAPAPVSIVAPGRELGEDDRAADLYALGVLLLQLLSGTRLDHLKLAELAARLPRDLPSSLRESIGRALSDGGMATGSAPRALAAHLAFDAEWLQALEPVTGPVGMAQPDFGCSGVQVFGCSGVQEDGSEHTGLPDNRLLALGALAPLSEPNTRTPEHPNTRTPEHRLRRWPAAAVLGVLLVLGIGSGVRREALPTEPAATTASLGSWIGIQIGPVPDHHRALSLQRRMRRFWPAALVRLDAGRYWVQVTTSAWPYRARAVARRLRAQGFPVRTVSQPQL